MPPAVEAVIESAASSSSFLRRDAFSYIGVRLVGGYGIQPVLEILQGSAFESANPAGHLKEDR